MSYVVKQGKTGYNIIEKDTDVLIELERSESHVRALCRKLNLGSGFNGWTPGFFSEKMNTPNEGA